ncbi:MAG TPA: SAM-dependent methyltransferase [Cryomorphaceae bacterium]|nr:SAM-dependent methyltransferase [Cryomorphaceae bacterium]
MKIGSPASRLKLDIKPNDRVLDIGNGDFPHPRANVCVDKYTNDNTHRSSDIKVLPHQTFMQADGENLPFEDNEFDYVICEQVLEHVEHPEKFIKEMCRVAKKGYLETPSLVGEYLIPKQSHKWVLLDIAGTVVMYEKEKLGMSDNLDFGELFLNYFPRQSIGWKIVQRTHNPAFTMSYEWKDQIDFLINPDDERILDYFRKPWTLDMISEVMPQRSLQKEANMAFNAFLDITRSIWKSKVLKK